MKILFSTFGSLGDIHPYIALAREAQARGHIAILATAPKYQSKIENLGLEFRAVRPDLPREEEFGPVAKKVMDSKRGSEYLFKEMLTPTLRQNYADLLEAGEDADIIITHPAALGGPLAAVKLGKKWLSSALAPISTWSIYDPPVPPRVGQLDGCRVFGPLWGLILKGIGRAATRGWVREVDRLRVEEGITHRGHAVFEGQSSPFGTIALFSSHFAAPQRDWPPLTTATGFCFYDAEGYSEAQNRKAQEKQDWREWVARGEPPIVFTLGSSAVFNSDEFLAASRLYVREYKARAIYVTGGVVQFASPLEAGELALDYAPFSELFPCAKFVVHQGGIGTTAQALRAGVPQMIVPHAHDQPDNAGRITRLGLGQSVALQGYKDGASGRKFGLILESFDSFSAKSQAIGAEIRAENGPRAACEVIERLYDF